jgi:hypothetical protein
MPPSTSSDVDIDALLDKTIISGVLEPREITRRLLDELDGLDAATLHAVLAHVLPTYVYGRMSARRRERPTWPERPRAVSRSRIDAHSRTFNWQRRLDDLYPTPSTWKHLRDMTADDLAYARDIRVRQADALTRHANELDRIRDAVIAAGITSVGELPENVLRDLLTDSHASPA